MSSVSPEPLSREDRVNEAIAAYLQAVERGEKPDLTQFLAGHTDIAAELNSFFANQSLIRQAARDPLESRVEAAQRGNPPVEAGSPSDPYERTLTIQQCGVPFSKGVVRYFGDYELVQEIARGGMGVVFKARQVTLNRIVAVKMILGGHLAGPEDVQRFHTEAEAAAQLDHPGIVPIYEVGEYDEQHYFSMGFVEGQSLAKKVVAGPLPAREAAEIVEAVATAVQYAHSKGVIHRDLKPGNILLDTQGKPRVTDFGLAKLAEGGSELTGSGQILGTPSYMPPEQASGKTQEAGPQADVYALGAILYCLLTGRPPFQAASAMDTLLQVLNQEPVAPCQLNPDIPLDLETIALKCLDKSPLRRYGSARDLAEELKRYLHGRPIIARPVGRMERFRRWCLREPVIASLSALVAVTLIAGTIIAGYYAVLASQRALEKGMLADENGKLATSNEALFQTEKAAKALAQERAEKLKVTLATKYYEQGLREYDEGRPATGAGDLMRALAMTAPENPLYGSYLRVVVDRCMQGGKQTAPPLWHGGPVKVVAFGPDGTRVVTGGEDQTARLWDAQTGLPIGKPMIHEQWVMCAAFSPDGTRIATGSGDLTSEAPTQFTARIWDATTGVPLTPPMMHPGRVRCVAFSSDGKRLLTASGHYAHDGRECSAQLWNVTGGTAIGEAMRHTDDIRAIAFSLDGTIATASDDGTARLWDGHTGASIGTVMQHPGPVTAVAFSPDGTRVVTGSGDDNGAGRGQYAARLWGRTGVLVRAPMAHRGPLTHVAFSPDGTRIATATGDDGAGNADNTARLWSAETGALMGAAMRHDDQIRAVAFNSDGTRLISGSDDRTVRIWNAQNGTPVSELMRHEGAVTSVGFSPNGSRIVSGSTDGTARLWDARQGTPAGSVRPVGWIYQTSFSPDGTRFLFSDNVGAARLCDAHTMAPVGQPLLHANRDVVCASFDPSGNLIVTGCGDGTVHVWDAHTGVHQKGFPAHTALVRCVAFGPAGWFFVTGSYDHSARIWDSKSGAPISEPMKHAYNVNSVAVSPDGSRILTGSADQTARLWDARTGVPLGDPMRQGWIHGFSVAFSPDGKRVVTASFDHTARLWDASSGAPLGEVMQHEGEVESVAFSPDGTRIVTASHDKTARLWDGHSGAPLAVMRHQQWVMSVAFSPDGWRVVTGSHDGTARLWDGYLGTPVGEVLGNNRVHLVAFSPDGAHVATASPDAGVFVWDVATPDLTCVTSPALKQILGYWTGYDADTDGSLHRASLSHLDEVRQKLAADDPLTRFLADRLARRVDIHQPPSHRVLTGPTSTPAVARPQIRTPATAARVNKQAIADVASGKLKQAKASWWGFDEADATACLQNAIASRVSRLIVDNVGKPWIVTPLTLVSDQEIVFEKGVEVLAKEGEFKGTEDAFFTARLVENVTLSGYGATLRMRRGDYADATRYARGEWRNILNLLSCRNVKVLGLTLTESGGDGIYLGAGKPGVPNRDVLIKDVTCHRNYRQGISVITAENLLIDNVTLSETAGTAPQAGIDFEPNLHEECLVNCVVRNCVSRNNAGPGFLAALMNLNARSPAVSLRVENCKSLGNGGEGVLFITRNAPNAAVTGTLDLVGCEVRENRLTPITLVNNPPGGCRVRFKDCSLATTAAGNPDTTPIVFAADDNCVQDLAGATFENVSIAGAASRPPLRFDDQSGMGLEVVGIEGAIKRQEDGQERLTELTEATLKEWMPQLATRRIPRVKLEGLSLTPLSPFAAGKAYQLGLWQLRGTGVAGVWARQGERVTVMIGSYRVGQLADSPIEVAVVSPDQNEILKQNVPFGRASLITFTATETGLYRLTASAGENSASFQRSTHPLGFVAGTGGAQFIYSTGVLYFIVPEGVKEFGVWLRGEGRDEGVRATLHNPEGKVVAQQDNIVRPQLISVEGPPAVPGVWSLMIDRPGGVALEDYGIELLGIPPLLLPTKSAVLTPQH